MSNDNIYHLFPSQVQKRRKKRWDQSAPTPIFRKTKELKSFSPKKFDGEKELLWKMMKYIRTNGLYPCVVIDSEDFILGGADLVEKAKKSAVDKIPIVHLPVKKIEQKVAFSAAYQALDAQGNKGRKVL